MGAEAAWVKRGLNEAKFIVSIAFVQFVHSAVIVLNKLAAEDDMNLRIVVVYKMMFAAVATVPLSLVFEIRKCFPKITWRVIVLASVIALLGETLNLNMYVVVSLRMTSATFASAMANLVPVITFLLAASFRMEKWGTAKLVGTLIEICGVAVLTFYKGIEIIIWPSIIDLRMHDGKTSDLQHNNLLGVVLIACYCFTSALSLIIRDKLSKIFPYPWTSTALISLIALVQNVVLFALCTEISHDMSQWRLGWDIRLLDVTISGIFSSGLATVVVAWCVQLKGPLFVSLFSPLTFVLVAIAGSLLLNEKLHLGRIIGFILMIGGLLVMIWGKSKETTVETLDHSANIEEAIEMANPVETDAESFPIIITFHDSPKP